MWSSESSRRTARRSLVICVVIIAALRAPQARPEDGKDMARRIAIVTGGNRGIGREIARQLMRSDVFVVIGSRDSVKGEAAAEELRAEGPNIASFPLDVSDTRSVQRFLAPVAKHN